MDTLITAKTTLKIDIRMILILLYHCVPSSYSESPQYFQTSRVPVQDLQGLIQVLTKTNANPLTPLLTPEVIQKYGYSFEAHQVQTKDGYILTMHRIPYSKRISATTRRRPKPVVYLQHGLFASSFEWFMNEEQKLLPLQLSDAGYDVWLGNARGNVYSRAHRRLTTRNREFWEFSVHEMGKYDIPAEIDHILNTTGQKQLSYVGFSMGTTMFWVMLSLRPEYNAKVKVMIALAPVVYLNNMMGFPRFLAPVQGSELLLKQLMDTIMNGEFLPPWMLQLYNSFYAKFCSITYIAETICSNLVFFFAGYDLPQTQINQLPLFFSHTPSPTSTRVLTHLAQFINSGRFREYYFGRRQNLVRYRRLEPPEYKLQNTRVPVALIYGPNDAVVNPVDAKKLASVLPNVIFDMPVNFTFWNHFDYHLGRDANELVHNHVLDLLSRY